jgi:Tol biopolymer transport system component
MPRSIRSTLQPGPLRLRLAGLALLGCVLAACDGGPAAPGPQPPQESLLFVGADQWIGSTFDVFRVPAVTGLPENLTRDPRAGYDDLALSPDGNRVLFTRGGDCDLHEMNTDGTGRRALTRFDPGGADGCASRPRWSRDGSRIAFHDQPTIGWPSIRVVEADGSGGRVISSAVPEAPSGLLSLRGWSPDGRVAIERRTIVNCAYRVRVYLVEPDGSSAVPLFTDPEDHSPWWSPDGSKVAFIRGTGEVMTLHVMNADGSEVRSFSRWSGLALLGPARFETWVWSPWSPDGKWLVFAEAQYGRPWLVIAGVDQVSQEGLVWSDWEPRFKGWSPSGTWIAFTSKGSLYRMNRARGSLRAVAYGVGRDAPAAWLPAP